MYLFTYRDCPFCECTLYNRRAFWLRGKQFSTEFSIRMNIEFCIDGQKLIKCWPKVAFIDQNIQLIFPRLRWMIYSLIRLSILISFEQISFIKLKSFQSENHAQSKPFVKTFCLVHVSLCCDLPFQGQFSFIFISVAANKCAGKKRCYDWKGIFVFFCCCCCVFFSLCCKQF